MGAGARDRKITIENKGAAQNSYGEVDDDYTIYAQAWAAYKPVRSQERMMKNIVWQETAGIFKTPYIHGVNSQMRINDHDKIFEIIGVIEVGRRQGLEIHVREMQVG